LNSVRCSFRFRVRILDAAARDAAIPGGAGGLADLTALLHAGRADLLGAAGGQLGLSDADFACVARIDTSLHLRTGLAFRRIADRIDVAASHARRVFRTEPHGVIDAGQVAAAEAVTSVGRERTAIARARCRLRHIRLRARAAIAGNARSGVVRALATLGRITGADFERVALVAPVAVVVSSARILIEVTIRLAGRIVLSGNTAVEAIFGVVAGPEALAVL